MMLSWQVLDVRAKMGDGCYFISLVHHQEGDFYIARYCMHPSSTAAFGHQSRPKGVGHSRNLEDTKIMCNEDADLQCAHKVKTWH